MTTIGSGLLIVGDVFASEDFAVAGRVEGPLICEGASVVVLATGEVTGDIIARDVTVHGRVTGRLLASDFVDIPVGGVVAGGVMTPRFILADGAQYHGRVEPQHLDAALKVFWFEREKRGAWSPPAAARGA
jgi:cytoskeletal protein CcmA (bactofilin family)